MHSVAPWYPPQTVPQLVAAGRSWDAVRVRASIGEPVLARLGKLSGAVFREDALMYWLILPGTADAWTLPSACGVDVRRESTYVTVPPATRTTGPGPHWLTPLATDRYLTPAELLEAALTVVLHQALGPRTHP